MNTTHPRSRRVVRFLALLVLLVMAGRYAVTVGPWWWVFGPVLAAGIISADFGLSDRLEAQR